MESRVAERTRIQEAAACPSPFSFQAPSPSPAPVSPSQWQPGRLGLPHPSTIPVSCQDVPLLSVGGGNDCLAFAGGDDMVEKPRLLAIENRTQNTVCSSPHATPFWGLSCSGLQLVKGHIHLLCIWGLCLYERKLVSFFLRKN